MGDGRVERGDATRQRLLKAGRALFGKHGYDATSIEAILDATGASRGSFYHHFATKQALFDAVLNDVVAEVATKAARAAGTAPDPVSRLRAGFGALLDLTREPSVQRIALLDAPAVVGWKRWREIDGQHSLGGLRATMHEIAEQHRLPPGDVDLFAHMLMAAVGEAALVIAMAEHQDEALKAARAAVDALIDRLTRSNGATSGRTEPRP